jgi:hypothetical protein
MNEILAELQAAMELESTRVIGYNGVLVLPVEILGQETQDALNNALQWSQARQQLLLGAIVALNLLIANDYPNRAVVSISAQVKATLDSGLEAIQEAIDDFVVIPGAL